LFFKLLHSSYALKILVIKPSSLGDVVHSLRVTYQIHCYFPFAIINWVIKEELSEILLVCGFINKIYRYKRGGGLLSYIKLANQVRETEYDYVVDMQGLSRSGCLTFLAKGKSKLGVADGREFSTFFYKCVGEKSRKKEIHAIDKLTPFLPHLGIDKFDPSLPLNFKNSVLNRHNSALIPCKPFLLLFPESRRPEKMWPYFEELFRELKKHCDYEIVIAGNKMGDDFKGSIDVRGKLSLSELPCLVSKAKVVLTNDSAPLHIATALNVATVALFGPTSQFKYGPYPKSSGNFKVIKGEGNKMNTISTEEVLNEIKNFLINGRGENYL